MLCSLQVQTRGAPVVLGLSYIDISGHLIVSVAVERQHLLHRGSEVGLDKAVMRWLLAVQFEEEPLYLLGIVYLNSKFWYPE